MTLQFLWLVSASPRKASVRSVEITVRHPPDSPEHLQCSLAYHYPGLPCTPIHVLTLTHTHTHTLWWTCHFLSHLALLPQQDIRISHWVPRQNSERTQGKPVLCKTVDAGGSCKQGKKMMLHSLGQPSRNTEIPPEIHGS